MTRESSIDSAVHRSASEAAIEALRSAGFNSLATTNSFYAASLTDHVVSAVKSFSATQMASLSSNSSALVATALASLDKVIGQLTPAQQAAAKAGIDPANTAAVAAFAAHGGSGLFADAKLGVGGVGRSGGHSSNDFQRELTGGHYTASNLPSSLRGLVDPSQGITPAHVAGVANYLGGLGLNPQSYAPYFVGSSADARRAIADHIKNGKAVTDDDVKKPRDVAAYIGAIKSGKMKLGDAPPSVQQIIGDMKKQGIDPVNDPKAVKKYLDDHPKALDDAKKAGALKLSKVAAKTNDQLKEGNLNRKVAVVDGTKGPTKTPPKVESAKLM